MLGPSDVLGCVTKHPESTFFRKNVRRRKGDRDCDDLEGDDGTRGRVCGMENLIKDHSRVVFSILSEAPCRYSQFGSTVHAESRTR